MQQFCTLQCRVVLLRTHRACIAGVITGSRIVVIDPNIVVRGSKAAVFIGLVPAIIWIYRVNA